MNVQGVFEIKPNAPIYYPCLDFDFDSQGVTVSYVPGTTARYQVPGTRNFRSYL
jgi:hypothetical protein